MRRIGDYRSMRITATKLTAFCDLVGDALSYDTLESARSLRAVHRTPPTKQHAVPPHRSLHEAAHKSHDR